MDDFIFKNWKAQKVLAKGGQHSTIYLVIRPEDPEPSACKQILLRTEQARMRFIREVKAQSSLVHKNIIKIIDSNIEEVIDNPPEQYGKIIMPYAGQGNLHDQAQVFKGVRDLSLLVFRLICEAVDHAHQHGVVHRDLKPKNILFKDNIRNPLLADFGICYVLEEDPDQRITRVNETVGPDDFMAPEQARGRNEKVDSRVDIYSLGKILYYMLSGGSRIYREEYSEQNRLSVIFDDARYQNIERLLLDKMIQFQPEDRFSSVREAIEALDLILQENGNHARRNGGSGLNGLSAEDSDKREFLDLILRREETRIMGSLKNSQRLLWDSWDKIYGQSANLPDNYDEALNAFKDSGKRLYHQFCLLIDYDQAHHFDQALEFFQTLFDLQENRTGNVGFLSIPLVFIHHLFYYSGAFALRKGKVGFLAKLLDYRLRNKYYVDFPEYSPIIDIVPIFFPQFFNGSPLKVFKDLTNDFKDRRVPGEYFDRDQDRFVNSLCQLDLVISLIKIQQYEKAQGLVRKVFVPNFGIFYGERVLEFLNRLKQDLEFFDKMMNEIFKENGDHFQKSFPGRIEQIQANWRSSIFSNDFSWDSVNKDSFSFEE